MKKYKKGLITTAGRPRKKELCESKEIAELFGVTVRRIQQLTQDGVISSVQVKGERGRRYEKDETVKTYIKYLSDKANGKATAKGEAELKEQKLKVEIALKESQRDLHVLRTDIAAGKYITVEEVKLDYSRFFVAFKKFALSLPNKIAWQVAGSVEPTELRRIENEMQQEVKRLLKSFVVSAVVERENDEEA